MCYICAQRGFAKNSPGCIDPVADDGSDVALLSSFDTVGETTSTAQSISIGNSITGYINSSTDEDWFRVTLTAGNTYAFALNSSVFDTYIRLRNSSGITIAFDNDSGTGSNSLLSYTATTTGTYYIEADAVSTGTGQYSLISALVSGSGGGTGTTDAVGETTSTASSMNIGTWITGTIDNTTDEDWYAVTLTAGQSYQFNLNGSASLTDTYIRIRDASGNMLASDDDSGPGFYSQLTYTATTTGTYYIEADAFGTEVGQYTLASSVVQPPLPYIPAPAAPTSLLNSIRWGTMATNLPGDTLTVYFAGNGESLDGENSHGWSTYDISRVMAAFQHYSNFINLNFVQTTDSANADFRLVATTLTGGSLAYFNPPGETNPGVGVFATNGAGWNTTGGLEQGGYGYVTLIHEIGHGLGLAHPHDDGGTSSIMSGVFNSTSTGSFGLNQGVFTTMSYVDGWSTAPQGGAPFGGNYGFQGTAMALDVAMLQAIYGANSTRNIGNNTYSLATTNAPGTFYQVIWDTGGSDAITVSGSASATIDLRAATLQYETGGGGFVSYVAGVHGGFTIANGVVIENAYGAAGADNITGNTSNNYVDAAAGNDFIIGGLGVDTIYGGIGDDVIYGNSATAPGAFVAGTITADGGDSLYGNDGNDSVFGNQGNDLAEGGLGVDTIYGGFGDDVIYGNSASSPGAFVAGTITADGGDSLFGNDGNDNIFGNQGDDRAEGGLGADVIYGGFGDDVLYGNSPNSPGAFVSGTITADGGDRLFGNDGNDAIYGNQGDDVLEGGLGVDTVYGGFGDDIVYGNSASASGVFVAGTSTADTGDFLFGNDGNDTVYGDQGNDYLEGGSGNDALYGGVGDDSLIGGTGDDTLNGGDGDDLILAGEGVDTVDGGAGVDTFTWSQSSSAGSLDLNAETFSTGGVTSTVRGIENSSGGAGNDQFVGGAGINILVGNAGNDTLSGGGGNDTLDGGLGDDTLSGDDGDDQLDGGEGNDLLNGGAGSDRLNGGGGFDTVRFIGLASAFSILESAPRTWTVVETLTGLQDDLLGIEKLVFDDATYITSANLVLAGGADNDTLEGGAGNDTLTGNGGNDTLSGGAGDDTLDGGTGDDTLNGGDGNDVLISGDGVDVVDGKAGIDRFSWVASSVSGALDLSAGTFSVGGETDTILNIEDASGGAGNDVVTGSAGDNVFFGNAGNDTLSGGAGNDTLDGGVGNDTLSGGDGDDVIISDAGIDAVDGGAGTDTFSWALSTVAGSIHLSLNQFTTGGVTETVNNIENATGGSGNDDFEGTNGDNVFIGGAGNDTLNGGAGDDTLNGGEGDDLILSGDGLDLIDGGAGTDTFSWTLTSGAASLDLVSGAFTLGGVTETLVSIENAAGGFNADVITGSAGDNVLRGGGGNDTLQGGAGNDTLDGEPGDDTLNGGDGNDLIMAAFFGNDTVDGGSGTDTYSWSTASGAGTVNLVTGTFTAEGVQRATLLNLENATGGSGNDSFVGDAAGNVFIGGAGNDTFDGGAGNDTLNGGEGDDVVIYAGIASLYVIGRSLNGNWTVTEIASGALDTLTNIERVQFADSTRFIDLTLSGGSSNDTLNGNGGNDTLQGWLGSDTLSGGAGDDLIYGNSATSGGPFLTGTITADGADALYGEEGNDTLYGNQGDDHLYGDEGNDSLFGGFGDDRLDGGAGNDTVNGNDGADWIVLSEGDDTADGGAGTDIFDWSTTLPGAGAIDLRGGTFTLGVIRQQVRNFENAMGGTGDDIFTGNDDHNQFIGNDGNDIFHGGLGNDWIVGGAGDDLIYGNSSTSPGAFVAGTITADGSDLLIGGFGNDTIYGNQGTDSLYGEDGNDLLYGGFGDDLLTAGAGNDTLYGNDGEDWALYPGFANAFNVVNDRNGHWMVTDLSTGEIDELFSIEFVSFDDRFIGINAGLLLTGDAGDNTLVGGVYNDDLFGNAGNDTLIGGAGNDGLYGGDGDDLLMPGDGSGYVDGGSGIDTLSWQGAPGAYDIDMNRNYLSTYTGGGQYTISGTVANVENVIGGEGDDRVFASSSANLVLGNGGNDYIDASDGNDRAEGGLGVDSILGGAGDDILYGNSANSPGAFVAGTITADGGDSIYGGSGNDTMYGNQGDDFLLGEGGNDTINGGFGNDTIYGFTPYPPTEGTQPDGADQLYGNDGNDSIYGYDGDDLLSGGGGNDSLDGGAGTDTAAFTGNRSAFSIANNFGGSWVITNILTGEQDVLSNIERVQFDDGFL